MAALFLASPLFFTPALAPLAMPPILGTERIPRRVSKSWRRREEQQSN
jgi:hypothetical protein